MQTVHGSGRLYCLAVSFVLLAGLAHAGSMQIASQFGVTSSGGVSYSIPVTVPPGTAGIEPRLALAYSSHSGNGGNCVETMLTWQKSSRSGNGGNCVEVARVERAGEHA